MIDYTSDLAALSPADLQGFFVGWPSPPTPQAFLEILRNSSHVVLAKDGALVVGFVNAVSDGRLSAYIPLLEVLPEHHGQGIGQELVRRIREQLHDVYMVDVMCDEDLVPFYEKAGMSRATGMVMRNYDAPVLHGA